MLLNKKTYLIIVLFALYILHPFALFSQQPPLIIKKSTQVETIEGKKFYLHLVEKGQTLYSIARTYSTTVDIVLANNPDALDGLKYGSKLRIPYKEITEVKKNIISKPIETKTSKTKPIKEIKSKSHKPDTIQKFHVRNKEKPDTIFGPKKDSLMFSLLNTKPIGDIHVAVFLPLGLNSAKDIDIMRIVNGSEKIPTETEIGIEFYEGVKMAFDSLRKQGFKGFLHIYDYNEDSTSFDLLIKNPELKEMNLIIGPLYGKRFESVLKFAKMNHINIVSPTIQNNNMLSGNPNVSKTTPSYIAQSEKLAKFVVAKYAGENILLFNSAQPKDVPYLNAFKRVANPILNVSDADTVKEITQVTMDDFMSTTKPNIVIIPSTNQSFITEAVNKLFLHKQENKQENNQKKKDSIIVLGLSNFMEIKSLDFGYLNELHSINTACKFVDYSNADTKKFILKYRKNFKTEPTEYVFSGFDVTYYYLKGLQEYGNNLQSKLPELKQKGIQTEFNFFQTGINNGYENQGIGIMKFENYSYKRIQ